MADKVNIVHDGTGGKATINRSALAAHQRVGWRVDEPKATQAAPAPGRQATPRAATTATKPEPDSEPSKAE